MFAPVINTGHTLDNGFGGSLRNSGYDVGMFRPFLNDRGEACVTVNTGKYEEKNGLILPVKQTYYVSEMMARGRFNPTFNATSLRKQDWQYLDKRLLMATRSRLRAWTDLAASSSIGGFDAMAKMTYEYEAMSDPGEAMESMDGRASGRNDTPLYYLSSVPLPIYFSDFSLGMRQNLISGNSGTPISTTLLEAGGRRIAERIERTVIGTLTGVHYGTISSGPGAHRANSQVYGYTNFPQRVTKTDVTTPTGSNPNATVDDVLEMRDLMYDNGFYGPFMLYHSTDWDRYLDDDYGQTAGSSYGFAPNKTLRSRLKEIDGIQDVRRLDLLPSSTNPFNLILIQMTSEVAEAIDGASPRVQQWETKGGWELNMRVYAIQVPVLKYDANDNCGIVHGTTS